MLTRLFALILMAGWSASALSQRIELAQTLDFKWQALTVATLQFDVSLPVAGSPDDSRVNGMLQSQIRIIGETKGPLSWIQDYQATVAYSDLGSEKPGSVFALQGLDGGEPEQRRIIFVDDQLPRIEVFIDSTASQPLAPKEEWVGTAENPLEAFKAILQAAVQSESCANEIWGFDGKRRYRLEVKDLRLAKAKPGKPSTPDASSASASSEKIEQYQCSMTLYAQGRETTGIANESKPAGWRSRFASLWPFSDSDREIIFYFNVVSADTDSFYEVRFQKIMIPTAIGAIVAQSQ